MWRSLSSSSHTKRGSKTREREKDGCYDNVPQCSIHLKISTGILYDSGIGCSDVPFICTKRNGNVRAFLSGDLVFVSPLSLIPFVLPCSLYTHTQSFSNLSLALIYSKYTEGAKSIIFYRRSSSNVRLVESKHELTIFLWDNEKQFFNLRFLSLYYNIIKKFFSFFSVTRVPFGLHKSLLSSSPCLV